MALSQITERPEEERYPLAGVPIERSRWRG